MAPSVLRLAKGVPVVCLMNLPSMGLMNGTRLIVDGHKGHLLHAHHFVNGEREDVYIPRVTREAQVHTVRPTLHSRT
eukprot:COSAG06_NODE_2252_length_7232_cov_11.789149_4_plen_77_part_00